jgi:hypothetical protein
LQYVDLFPDWQRGVRRVMKTIRTAPSGRGSMSAFLT